MKTQSIQFRIISAIVLILLFSVSLSIYLTTNTQRNNLLDSARRTLSINTEMLNLTIRNIMLSGEAPIANNTINDIRNISEFTKFDLFRPDGTAAFNDFSTLQFVNNYQDMFMFDETPRSDKVIIDNPAFQRVLAFNTPFVNMDMEKREMEYFFPILNYKECRGCHGDEPFIRGISHFRISLDGIYDQVRQAGIFLTLFFLSVGVVLFAGLLLMLRRIIIQPVLKIGDVVSIAETGNLDVQIDLNRGDELGDLAKRINNMIAGLKERNELQLQNRVIETRLEENRKYLDNITEGLLMLNSSLRITEQYSSYLTGMFGIENPAGMDIGEFIYGTSEKLDEDRKELTQFLQLLSGNINADMDMFMSINPLDEKEVKIAGEDRIIHADFQRITRDNQVENIMMIFEDRTDLLRTREELEQQKQQRESEMAQIAAILKVGPAVFEGFIKEAWKTFRDLQNNLMNLDDEKTLSRLFRDIHSVKGTARYLDYNRIDESAHQIEDMLAEIRDNGKVVDNSTLSTIGSLLNELFTQMEGVELLIERFREFSSVKSSEAGAKNPILTVFEEKVSLMVQKLADDLGKKVNFSIINPETHIPELQSLQSSLFHILRNALDHGIEDPMERLSLGKQDSASLIMEFSRNKDGALVCEIRDDGRGIDLDEVEKKGIEKGLLKPGSHFPSQILRVLFMPGFSSRDTADEISGRGVGLDAVREDMRKLKGKITVTTSKNKGSRFILILPPGVEL